METLRIEIINKKARRVLNELADQNFISIKDPNSMKSLQTLLTKLRSNKKKPTQREITKEVELVRTKRYGKKS